MKKPPSKVGSFCKLAEIFSNDQTAQSVHRQKKYKIIACVFSTRDKDLWLAMPQAIKGYLKTTAQGKENAKEVNGPRISLRKQ